MKTRVTIETISDQLDEDRAFAQRVDQAGPALNATVAKAKLHGLIVDRKESGAPGDFAGMTDQDVIATVRRELGDEAAALLIASVAKQDDEQAIDIKRDPSEPLN